MKILLINPGNPPGSGRDLYTAEIMASLSRFQPFHRANYGAPLALTTLAALTPRSYTVKIVDEMVEDLDPDEACDAVGITAMTFKVKRAYAIARGFRRRGIPVILGGVHASMCPEEAAAHADSIVIGEADLLWPRICRDLEQGVLKPVYRSGDWVDLQHSPIVPRYDLLKSSRYLTSFLQTARGCPQGCKFCTVTVFNGKKVRRKTPGQVIREIEALPRLRFPRLTLIDRMDGGRKKRLRTSLIFIVDDNFTIHRRHARAVCEALIEYQEKEGVALCWVAQADLSVGQDSELLSLMSRAGCQSLLIGFESLDVNALREMNKKKNTPELYETAIRNMRRAGIDVIFSFIIGADHDTPQSGDCIVEFLNKNDVFYCLPNIYTPYPGTKLWSEMDRTGRLHNRDSDAYNVRNAVFSPRNMTSGELKQLYIRLCHRLLNLDRLLARGRRLIRRPQRYYLSFGSRLIFWSLFNLSVILLCLRGRIRVGDALRALASGPFFLLVNGSLSALGYLGFALDQNHFAESEVRRP